MRKLFISHQQLKIERKRRYQPRSNEHIQVVGRRLDSDGDQHDRGTNPDGELTPDTIGEVWSEGICRQGTDVLQRNQPRALGTISERLT